MRKVKGLLQFHKSDIKKIRQIVYSDAKFLQQLKLIDYSLLLAVEELKNFPNNDFEKSRHTFLSNCGRYAYHIAIIDYLTEWNFMKQIESFWKVSIKNNKDVLVSAVNHELYASRFIKFINSEVITNEEEEKLSTSYFD